MWTWRIQPEDAIEKYFCEFGYSSVCPKYLDIEIIIS